MNNLDITDSVISSLRRIIRAIDLQSKKLTRLYGLTGPQLIVLKEIQKSSDSPISVISKNVSLSQATVTSILNRLEQQGFAERKRSSNDKRKVNIELTQKSIEILESNPRFLQEEFVIKFEKLEAWEKSMILTTLQKLAHLMNADDIDTTPVLVSGPIDATSEEVNDFLS
ncbi:MAG: MarR family transcriptional regulator [Spirochaetales bacterium]|nr:MarR family transcriptional regulator [Spirochaetales bacterium]